MFHAMHILNFLSSGYSRDSKDLSKVSAKVSKEFSKELWVVFLTLEVSGFYCGFNFSLAEFEF